MAESKLLPVGSIELNTGQIEGVKENPRRIETDKFQKLVKSIKDNPEMLELRELLVYPHQGKFVCIGGNMRFLACQELGIQEIPCKIIPAATTPETLNAYIIKDNASFGEWDWDKLANQWEAADLEKWGVDCWQGDEKPEAQLEAKEDGYDESDMDEAPAVVKPGEVWQLGRHRLMCGDSTDPAAVAKLMNGELADLWLTDPPYNVNIEGSNGKKIANDNMKDEAFRDFLIKAYNAANQQLKMGGVFYIWHGENEGFNFREAARRADLHVRQCLIWNKNQFVLGRQDYQWKHEPCLYGWKEGAAHYFTPDRSLTTVIEDRIDIKKLKKEEMQKMLEQMLSGATPTTVIDYDKPTRNAEHPTMKPVGLFGYLIKNSSKVGERVLDTFGGSGTTVIACEQLNRTAYLMELDPHYCDVIIDRWEKLTGQKAKRIE